MRILLNDISTGPCPTLYLPAVRGCTDSRALVKSAIFFEAPPCFTCCRWYFLSSESGIKRFIILWYWTSTWRRAKSKKKKSEVVPAAHQLHISCYAVDAWRVGLPCSTWGCRVYWRHRNGRLSCRTECGPRTLPSQSGEANAADEAGTGCGIQSEHFSAGSERRSDD